MPLSLVTSGLIYYDSFDYSDGTLHCKGQWSGSDCTDYGVNNGEVVWASDGTASTASTELLGAGFGVRVVDTVPTYSETCVGATVSVTTASWVDVGIMALGVTEQPLDNFIHFAAGWRQPAAGRTGHYILYGHRVAGAQSVLSEIDPESDDEFQNIGVTPTRLKLHAAPSAQTTWYNDVQRFSNTHTNNDGIPGRPGLYWRLVFPSSGDLAHWEDFFACTSNTIEVGGLLDGYKLKANGRTAIASGGTATLNMAEDFYPVNSLTVVNSSNKTIETLDLSSSVSTARYFGGDIYTWTAPSADSTSFTQTNPVSHPRLPWHIVWPRADSDFSDGVDYQLEVQTTSHLRLSAETARAHRLYDSVISTP